MVITVTLNPALDRTLIIEDFTLGIVNRASKERFDIGGKGINVSKVLKNLGIESKAIGFLGGMVKSVFLEELDNRGIEHQFVEIGAQTRTNIKVVDNKNSTNTDVNEAGTVIKEEELQKFIDIYKENCKSGNIIVISGGIPRGVSDNMYAILIKIAKERGAYTILDAEGELFKKAIMEKPYAIKPNTHELSLLFNERLEDENKIIEKAVGVQRNGVSKILVSLGAKGAIYVTDDEIYSAKGLKVEVNSTVGAGDSMVAAMVYSLHNDLSNKDTLTFAQACGASTVQLEGTEACTLDEVKSLLEISERNVRRVDYGN